MKDKESSGGGCGCVLLGLAINALLGGWSVQYCMFGFFDRAVPFWPAALAGLFLGEFTIPLAILIWMLRLAGLDFPLIPQ